jgi:DNA-binding response OmpR family regulator
MAGQRVLVAEDDKLIALDIAGELKRAGYTVVGPVSRLDAALALAECQDLDAAILDVFLDGAHVWPLGERLAARAVPFVFLTGFAPFLEFPLSFATVPRLEKPHRPGALARAIRTILKH